ncbi:MAG: HAD family hydrolase [Thermodesulfobacteriota bacterium]
MNGQKLVVFDMDGVIIDVSRSYREAVRQTARLFLRGAKGFAALPDPLFSLVDLARLKATGGLNNDWDLTAQALSLLFAHVNAPVPPTAPGSGPSYERAIEGCDASDLSRFLRAAAAPLMELFARCGRRRDPFVEHHFKGDVGTGNIVKEIFQEIYLGEALYENLYGCAPRFHRGEGLICKESLLIRRDLLGRLAERHVLAIATGRPRVEADHPLDRFSIGEYFQTVVTLDDCSQEEARIFRERGERVSLSKPDPFMLDLIPPRCGSRFAACYYLGDTPDDMLAARASQTGYIGLGVTCSSSDRPVLQKALLEAGAEHIIDDYSHLSKVIEAHPGM